MKVKPYNPPSMMWAIACIPIVLIFVILNVVNINTLIINGHLTDSEKFIFSIEIILMFAGIYLLIGYYYDRWASERKNELLQVIIRNKRILYEKYGRLIMNEEECEKTGCNPLRFRRLSQSDLRDIEQFICLLH